MLCIFLMKDDVISSDKHALIIPPLMGRGKRVHPVSFPDSSCKFTGSIRCKLFSFFRGNKKKNSKFVWLSVLVGVDLTDPPRSMDPKKDLAVYGYGTVAWKDRMEDWKRRQNDKLQVVKHEGGGGGGGGGGSNDVDELDDPDLPK
ncbi:hypothetical protein CsSME_00014537 [Camellia sinensis var. sinensis]